MVLDSVVCLCVLIIWVTARQMPAVVGVDKEWDFFLYVCVCFNYSLLNLPFCSSSFYGTARYRLKCFLKEPLIPGICLKI